MNKVNAKEKKISLKIVLVSNLFYEVFLEGISYEEGDDAEIT